MASENEPVNIKKNMMERRKRNKRNGRYTYSDVPECFRSWMAYRFKQELLSKAEMLMLIVSEVAEAMEGCQKGP